MDFINAFQRMNTDELREQVINLLKEAYSDGRINVESLERRLTEATVAGNKDELLALVTDIPAPKNEKTAGGFGSGNHGDDENQSWSRTDRPPRENETLLAVLGSSERAGRWQPAQQINGFSLMGSIKLDFREADFPRRDVIVNTGCIMGSMEILVPPGINVSLSGLPLLGSMENKCGAGDPGAPTISVKGLAIMGSVEIKRRELKRQKNEKKTRRGARRSRTSSV